MADVVSQWGLVDLVVAVVVVLSVLGALRSRAGILPAIASGASTLVLAWLVCWGLSAWAPPSVADDVRASQLARTVPFPQHATEQARQLHGPAAPA